MKRRRLLPPARIVPYAALAPPATPLRRHLVTAIPRARATVGDRATAYFYFDSLFPIAYTTWDPRVVIAQLDQEALLARVRCLLPSDEESAAHGISIEKILPRVKDGGAFVKFSFVPPALAEPPKPVDVTTPDQQQASSEKDAAAIDVEKLVKQNMGSRATTYKPWYIVGSGNFFLVQGTPWLEDMDRYPNSTIRIEFEGADIPQEQLYQILRPFGRIRDIVPQPSSNKDSPRWAEIVYHSTRSAAAARNCLHGFRFGGKDDQGGTVFRILYKERVKAHAFRDWMSNHPRIALPIVVALIGGLSYLVFDPIRAFSVRSKVEGLFDPSKYRALQWLKAETLDRFGLRSTRSSSTSRTGIEQEREASKDTLKKWLRDLPDTFITVTGPRGAGKHALVEDVVKDQKHVLTIDCETICKNAKGNDDKLVSGLAAQVGYFPQFGFLASINNLIDLASVGLIGQKAGFSAPLDAQIKGVLNVTAAALRGVADAVKSSQQEHIAEVEERRATREDRAGLLAQFERNGQVHDGRMDCVAGVGAMSELGIGIERDRPDDVYIVGPRDANAISNLLTGCHETESDETEVDRLPVVVITGYDSKAARATDTLWDSVAEWAAALIDNRIAHVVVVSDNVAISKPLSKALPGKPLNMISVNDASAENAIDYVSAKLDELKSADIAGNAATIELSKQDDSPADTSDRAAIAKLGGRQTDLEVLVQKLVAGQSINEAVDDIIQRSAGELKKVVFADGDADELKSLPWTAEQAWYLTKRLAKSDEIPYADVLHCGPFKGNDKALRALEQVEMISVAHGEHGKPATLRPGRPVYRSACAELVGQKVFNATQELSINAAAASSAASDLKAAEEELISLASVFDGRGNFKFAGTPTVPLAIAQRTEVLLNKMKTSEETIDKLAAEAIQLKKVLQTL